MYPELYPELEGRNRKLRGFALSLAGSFVFMVTTVASVAFSSQWLFAGVSGLSLGAVGLVFVAHRSRSFLSQVVFLIVASAVLATETGLVGMLSPVPLAAACAILTLGGCLVTARGIHDVESMANLDPFAGKRRREMTVEQQTGGE
ncbi:MAG TPA: hypothetical protein VLX56_07430 [Nitrososphaerales archaeon]|nr:hypothetical protein [Nitrososphaerales archaeon]